MWTTYRWAAVLLTAFSLFLFIGCAEDDEDETPPPAGPSLFEQMADIGDAYFTAGTKNITGEQLYADINNGVNLYIIDLRSSDHFQNLGHIANAHNWSIAVLPDSLIWVPQAAKVVCVCYSGQTASWATSFLRMMGFDAWNLKWGMCGWTGDTNVNQNKWGAVVPNGGALETEAHALTTEYEFPELVNSQTTALYAIGEECNEDFEAGLKTISANDLYANLNNGNAADDPFLLCYWNEATYNAGHIPGSFRFEPGSLGYEENLKYLPPNKQIVVYCYTGQTSSQVCTYLRMLGYDAYTMLFGMNAVTSDANILGTNIYHAPSTNYPVVTGP